MEGDVVNDMMPNYIAENQRLKECLFQMQNAAIELGQRVERYREALEWYAMEWLYDLERFRTAAPVYDFENPRNIEVDGNPVMHDKGKKAREALQEIKANPATPLQEDK